MTPVLYKPWLRRQQSAVLTLCEEPTMRCAVCGSHKTSWMSAGGARLRDARPDRNLAYCCALKPVIWEEATCTPIHATSTVSKSTLCKGVVRPVLAQKHCQLQHSQ
jgi:hypothetical protein